MKGKLTIFFFVFALGIVSFFIWAENFSSSKPPSAINYAPNFWFDSEEKYFPTDPLKFYYENGEEIPGEMAVEKYNRLSLEEKLKNIIVFYHIAETENEWVYQYWLFYVFNDYENEHYGDWESVFIFVDKNNQQINKVVGSAHGILNNELKVSGVTNNIWVYVGKGSHANCPDEIPDGECDFKLWKWGKQGQEWTNEDVKNGQKISYNTYQLKEINEDFIKNFGNQSSFNKEKSPDLGVNLFKALPLEKIGIPKPQEDIYIPFPGTKETPTFAWNQPQFNNPELIRPVTAVVMEKVQNFVNQATSFVQGFVNNAITTIQSTINQINPFKAELVQVFAPSAPGQIVPSISPLFEKPLEKLTEPLIETRSLTTSLPGEKPVPPQKLTFTKIQEQLDDIAEKIDVFSQEVAKLTGTTISPKIAGATTEESFPNNSTEIVEQKTETSKESQEETPQQLTQKTPSPGGYSTSSSSPAKILITEVQIEGDKKSYDFIELYNPNSHDVFLKNYRLVKRAKTSTSDTTIKSWSKESEEKIPAFKYYLWASNKDNYNSLIFADTSTSQTIADNNGIAIRYGEEDTGQIIDAVGWGDFNNVLFEGTAFPQNPAKNQSLERKKDADGNYIDTDDNSQDFKINKNPSPTNSQNQTFLYDTAPPETTLDQNSLPQNPTFSQEANFIFASNEENSTFECSLDEEEFQSCQSPKNYSNLSVGTHQFQVRAIDPAGNVDSTPASYTWTIENLPSINPLDVVINEIAWMGTPIEGVESRDWWRYEWLELYNNTNQPISLDGWKIEFYRDTLDFTIELSNTINAQNYFLIVSSDKIFSDYDLNYSNLGGKLNNNGQKVLLKDNFDNIIDEVDCHSYGKWFAGNNDTKQTMERKNSKSLGTDALNWDNSQRPGGTPKAQNSVYQQLSTPTPLWSYEIKTRFESVAISGDGNYIVAGSNDGKIYLFNQANNIPLWIYQTGRRIGSVSISSEGNYIAVGCDNGKVYLFERTQNLPIWEFQAPEEIYSVDISSDGNYLVAGTVNGRIYFFDRNNNNPLWTGFSEGMVKVDLSSDGSYLAVGSGTWLGRNQFGLISLYNRDNNTPLWRYRTTGWPWRISISSDGNYIVAGGWDKKVYLFNQNSGVPVWEYETGDTVYSVKISPGGNYISAGSYDNNFYLFDQTSNVPIWIYTDARGYVYTIDVSDNNYLAFGRVDGRFYLFNSSSNIPLWSYPTGNLIKSVSISSDGNYIAVGGGEVSEPSFLGQLYLFKRE